MTEATKVPNCPLVTGQRPCLCIMPRCPECAYTEHDAQFEGDHDRCNGKIPVDSAPEREKCHKIICPHRPAWKAAHHCPHCDGSEVAAFCICETASADEIREAFGAELKTFSPTFLETDVKSCARCGNDHPELRFVPFVFDAPPDASHRATCPQLKEPILLSIESLSWPGERCKRCGRRNNIGFSVPDETWAAVVRERWNVLCPACFDEEAEAAGIAYRFADPAAVSWSDWRDDDAPIQCGTFSEASLTGDKAQ